MKRGAFSYDRMYQMRGPQRPENMPFDVFSEGPKRQGAVSKLIFLNKDGMRFYQSGLKLMPNL